MSNPTELPDLRQAIKDALATADTASLRMVDASNDARIDRVTDAVTRVLARRAQPEGEAPQAVAQVYLDMDSWMDVAISDLPTWERKGYTTRTLYPAATLSPLCGAQHAESGKEVGVPGWEQRVNAVAPALRVKTKEQAMEAEIAGWRALAAQQAAAPGKAADAEEAAKLQTLLMTEFSCYRVAGGGLLAWAMNALLDNSPHRAPSAPGTPEAPKPPAHGHRDDYYLLANGRRLGLEPISRVRNMPNWVLAMELFATGSTSARQLCRDAGVHPDSTITHRAAQLDGGQEGSESNG